MKLQLLAAGVLLLAGFGIGRASQQTPSHVYELRVYSAAEGKLDALNARFRDHTRRIFDRHNMKSVGYWTVMEGATPTNTLIYILEHPSRDEARKNWAAFSADPEWQKVKAESEANGRLVTHVDSTFMSPTDYSAIK